jgi:peptide/nickel transport system substrate-binding protein
MMKRTVSAALSLSLALAPAAPALAAIKNPDTFVYATIGDPESLDPAWAYDSASHAVIDNVYETLLSFKGGGVKPKDLAPMLSTKVPTRANGLISADGLSYRFPIRKGVKFHDGAALTPEDVRYSLLRFALFDRDGGPSSLLLEPLLGVGSTRKGKDVIPDAYDRLAKAVTVDGDDVVVRLPKPFAPFLTILATYGDVMERAWCAAHGQWGGEGSDWVKYNNPSLQSAIPNTLANGTGPFKLDRFERNTKEVVLARNDAYWRKPARLKTVVIKVVDEFATRKLMLQAGDADSIYGPQMYFPQLQGIPGVELQDKQQTLDISPILFFSFHVNPVGNQNIGSGKLDGQGIPADFFSDKDVRKGFAYSIDQEAYVRDIQRGKGKPASSFLPPSMLGYRAGKPKYSYDPKQAAAHFQKAWGGKVWENGFKVSIVYNTGSTPAETICQMLKKNVEALNPKFHVDVRVLQWSTYLEQSDQGKLPMFTAAWAADYPDPHNFAFPLFHSLGYYPSKQGFKSPEMDALIEKAARTLDEGARVKLYARIHELWDEEVPNVLIAEGYRYRATRAWVKGYTLNPIFPDSPYNSYYYDIYKAE